MKVESVEVHAYSIPTEREEADGTLHWGSTGLVLVQASCSGVHGFGYSYTDAPAAELVRHKLAPLIQEQSLHEIPRHWWSMQQNLRNLGGQGLGAHAISATDMALWDLKARLLGLPLTHLLGSYRSEIAVYGSGGFTNWELDEIKEQIVTWRNLGCPAIKIKVGEEPQDDYTRLLRIRELMAPETELFVDANGGYDLKQALKMAELFVDFGVTWFEEPVSSQNLEGLNYLKDHAPSTMEITAGEYIYDIHEGRAMIPNIDVLQLDATRCMGVTGFMNLAAQAEAYHLPLSTHTAPLIHCHLACSIRGVRHLEYFWDHSRIEQQLWHSMSPPEGGLLAPPSGPGLGTDFNFEAAEEYQI